MPEQYFVFTCCRANASIRTSPRKKKNFDPCASSYACVKAFSLLNKNYCVNTCACPYVCACVCSCACIATVEPRFNEHLYNEFLDITNDILRPGQSFSKCME